MVFIPVIFLHSLAPINPPIAGAVVAPTSSANLPLQLEHRKAHAGSCLGSDREQRKLGSAGVEACSKKQALPSLAHLRDGRGGKNVTLCVLL